jgi:hypothetical protein
MHWCLADTNSIFCKIILAVSLGILLPAGTLKVLAVDSDGTALSASYIWTGQPDADQNKGACVAFRRHFQLADAEKKVMLQTFADTRYMLWVNGQCAARSGSF